MLCFQWGMRSIPTHRLLLLSYTLSQHWYQPRNRCIYPIQAYCCNMKILLPLCLLLRNAIVFIFITLFDLISQPPKDKAIGLFWLNEKQDQHIIFINNTNKIFFRGEITRHLCSHDCMINSINYIILGAPGNDRAVSMVSVNKKKKKKYDVLYRSICSG